MLGIGTKAPDFTLPDQNGEFRSLSDYQGQKVILYFYPKDMTAGCSKQACAFGELYPQFRGKGAVVLGVSKDSVASHKKFEERYGLPFTLLSDPEKEVIQAYDVWKEKKNYGKVSMGVVRTTYLIDENGIIVKAFGKVKAADGLKTKLLASENVNLDNKYKLLLAMLPYISKNNCKTCFDAIRLTEFSKIFEPYAKPKIQKTENNQQILDAMIARG